MKRISDPRFGFVVLLIAALMLFILTGCASWTEEYWAERYDSMTQEEIEEAKARGGELVQLCDLTDCIFVWIY